MKRLDLKVDGFIMETHGSIDTKIREVNIEIPQIVSKQVDINCDGILGRDFLRRTLAQICYKSRILTLRYKGAVTEKRLISEDVGNNNLMEVNVSIRKMTLPKISEIIVKLPVATGTTPTEGEENYKKGCTWQAVRPELQVGM
jgi:hypothetical protein